MQRLRIPETKPISPEWRKFLVLVSQHALTYVMVGVTMFKYPSGFLYVIEIQKKTI